MLDITTNSTTNEIINTFSYYPFGMTMAGSYSNNTTTPDTRYQYNSKEYNSDLGLNLLDYGARWYDACIGRFGTVDNWSEKYPEWTPYNYALNNPLRFIDPTGNGSESALDDYIFDEEGRYLKTEVTGKPDKLIIEDSKTGKQTSYNFNDPETDVKAIEYNKEKFGEDFKNMKFIYFIDDIRINEMMAESDVHERGYYSRKAFVALNSDGGKMDFSMYHLSRDIFNSENWETWDVNTEILNDKGPLFIISNQRTSYNIMDAGNWLWGNVVNRVGGSLDDAKTWSTKFNPNDSKEDQRAIANGWIYRMLYKKR